MKEILIYLLNATAIYFSLVACAYGVLLVFSWLKIKRWPKMENLTLPGVSFLIPAYNEESLIVETIQTYLSLPHPDKELIVVNDGSSDQTMKLLSTMYLLRKLNESIRRR